MSPTTTSTTTATKMFVACVLLAPSFQELVAARSLHARQPLRRHARRLASDSSDADWTYHRTANHGEEPYSPSEWHLGYPDCAGTSQSPINLSAGVESEAKASEFNLEFFGSECMSNELVFSADDQHWLVDFEFCDAPPLLSFSGEAYSLTQMHIHSPSEHMIGGSCHDAEIHLVHTSVDGNGNHLVVGIFLDAREYGSNVELEPLWEVLNSGATTTDDTQPTRAYDLLPATKEYSHYTGSLTTPPCTEGVDWIVMTTPTIIGKFQLEECRKSVAIFADSKVDELSNTNRACQSINDRAVYIV